MRLVLMLLLILASAAPANAIPERVTKCNDARQAVVFYRQRTWDWQWRLSQKKTPTAYAEKSPSCAYVRWATRTWVNRSRKYRQEYTGWFSQTYQKYLCIHQHEGAWNAIGYVNGVPTYYGGLQMDIQFQRTYGPEFLQLWGFANNWPVWSQLRAAERAYHSGRLFVPWPTYERYCT